MALIAWLLRVILFTVLLRFVLRLIAVVTGAARGPQPQRPRGPAGPRPAPRPTERAGGTLVRDPQCGTYVVESRAVRATTTGSVLYFCSDDCRRAYLAANPAAHSA